MMPSHVYTAGLMSIPHPFATMEVPPYAMGPHIPQMLAPVMVDASSHVMWMPCDYSLTVHA